MEPRIQYAKTADGVSIAFWTLGKGMPLVYMPFIFSHIQLEWQIPDCRRWYEGLAENRRLVRYDVRGMGLSDRDVTDLSRGAGMLDIDAVADRLGLDRFAVLGGATSGPVAIAYAARHPERVSHLILWSTYAQPSDWSQSPAVQSMRALMDTDWTFYTETAAHAVLGWSEGEPARRFAALIRESTTPEGLQSAVRALSEFDVAALLPRLEVPTLVLQRRQAPGPDVSVARTLASRIPDAHLILLEGESGAPYLGDTDAVLQAIDEFLGEGEEAAGMAQGPELGAFRTILFTDVEGSTSLTQRLGDARAREVLRTHERIVRDALRAHGGSEVKTMGDGFMASFSSATRALECAIAMQRAFADYNAALLRQAQDEHTEPVEVRVRIGLNVGEPIAEEEDLFGTAVILAAHHPGGVRLHI